MRLLTRAFPLLCLINLLPACAEEDDFPEMDDDGNFVAESGREEIDPATGMKTAYYYVSNPTADCSTALQLTAKGTGLTAVTPSGGGITWDSLTSGGTTSLGDTWFYKDTYYRMDKDWTGSSGYLALGTVTVKVTGTTVTKLSYWFTDWTGDCDHD